jgi:hypothetical protein
LYAALVAFSAGAPDLEIKPIRKHI